MKCNYLSNKTLNVLIGAAAAILFLTNCKGEALDFHVGNLLGDPTIEDGDGTRGDGSSQIYTVTKIVESTSDIPSWTNADLPFTGPRRQLGTIATDSQWPFEFTFTYPPNNYSLGQARVLLITSRDSSDTEAIFVDGVFTGRPPNTLVSGVSTKILHRNYSCSGCGGATAASGPANTYFIDWALNHYKISTQNTFDLDIADLLLPTPLTPEGILADGVLRVVTGDDAYVTSDTGTTSRPLLIMQGYTVSATPLACTTSPEYKYKNTYIHVDGNSIDQPAFNGTVVTPFTSWSANYTTFRSAEFYYDPRLPQLSDYTGFRISKAEISLQIKRTNTDAAAIVINGIGFDQTGFDRTQATATVEQWSASASSLSYWNTLVTSVTPNNSQATITINLLSLFSESKVKELLLQGKLNVSLAGPVASVYGQAATSTRNYGVTVNGPDLILEGTYTAELCEIPNDPGSPLNGGGLPVADCLVDTTGPSISSIASSQVTSTAATIQWLSSEPATSTVSYGVGGTAQATPVDSTLKLFHTVQLSGLSPYKYYQFIVRSADACGNQTNSPINVFRTQR